MSTDFTAFVAKPIRTMLITLLIAVCFFGIIAVNEAKETASGKRKQYLVFHCGWSTFFASCEISEQPEQVRRRKGVAISVGVSFSKAFARMGSNCKKADAIILDNSAVVWHIKFGEKLNEKTAARISGCHGFQI